MAPHEGLTPPPQAPGVCPHGIWPAGLCPECSVGVHEAQTVTAAPSAPRGYAALRGLHFEALACLARASALLVEIRCACNAEFESPSGPAEDFVHATLAYTAMHYALQEVDSAERSCQALGAVLKA